MISWVLLFFTACLTFKEVLKMITSGFKNYFTKGTCLLKVLTIGMNVTNAASMISWSRDDTNPQADELMMNFYGGTILLSGIHFVALLNITGPFRKLGFKLVAM